LAPVLAMTVVTVWRAWWPIEAVIDTTADDMYYYLETARNIADGRGPTFDGTNPTNGWHPLWMGILVLLRALTGGGDDLQVHLALTLLAVANAATGLLLAAIGGRLLSPVAGVAAAAAWMLHPWSSQLALAGVEAPLATAALALCLLFALDAGTSRGAARLGLAMGLACLARTDSVLLCTVVGLLVYTPTLRQQPRHGLVLVTRCVAAGAVLVGPWLLWNLGVFGRVSQDSARALAGLRHDRYFAGNDEFDFALTVPGRLWSWNSALAALAGLPAWLVATVSFGALVAAGLAWRRGHRARVALASAGLGILAIGAFYSLVMWFRQHWYLLSSLMLLSLLFGLAFGWMVAKLDARFRAGATRFAVPALLLALTAIYTPQTTALAAAGTWPWQRTYLDVARRLDSLPAGSQVGAFNAGIYGYFADLPVVNLDGVVNGAAYEAMREHKLLAYVRSEGITHVVDHERAFAWFMVYAEPEWADAFSLVARVPTGASGGDLLVTEVKPADPSAAPGRDGAGL
jgi:hypothetical protein